MVDSLRVFFSIDITNNSLLSKIREIQEKLDKNSAKMKIVKIENVHFTVRFLGETPISTVKEICLSMKEISFKPFDISIEGVGAFPTARKPRVIWVGVSQNANIMKHLKKQIDDLLHEFGFPPVKKFVPHATIARVRFIKHRDMLMKNLEQLADEIVGVMTVDTVRLTKSTLTSSGPIYETICETFAES